jgi:hypothetical protein
MKSAATLAIHTPACPTARIISNLFFGPGVIIDDNTEDMQLSIKGRMSLSPLLQRTATGLQQARHLRRFDD